MRKNVKKIISLFFVILIIFSFGTVFASIEEVQDKLEKVEYTEEYKEWLQLSEEERAKRIQPNKYNIVEQKDNSSYLNGLNNIFKVYTLLRANTQTSYSLKDVIPENVTIKNQMSTNSCWVFATIGALESHLALRDKNIGNKTTVYDFSEKHMNYATARTAFLNSAINNYGFTKNLSDGGNIFLAIQYMANGLGTINESDLPFEDSEANIDISQIQNKEVQATLYDTVNFIPTSSTDNTELIEKMKQHITNYGGIYAAIHGNDIVTEDSYNNSTGAIYCKSSITEPANHAIVIIGWDDNYSIENFNENQRPTSNGAWIIKNSWGDEERTKLSEIKEIAYNANPSAAQEMGYNTAADIPDELILEYAKSQYGDNKVAIQGDELVIKIGNDGYMYVSYEDCNIYVQTVGIEKATNTKDYENVYQHDTLGAYDLITYTGQESIVLANAFTRDATKTEYLDKISIFTLQGYTCKVFVNPNGNSKAKADLQEVALASGTTDTIGSGYRTIEFAQPIKLTGDSFVVVVQILNNDSEKYISVEQPSSGGWVDTAVYHEGESFITVEEDFNNNQWIDLGTGVSDALVGNLSIKAYTTSQVTEVQKILTEIYIQDQPTKTVYNEGENFDKTGMTVFAKYSDNTSQQITNYTVIGGENLTAGTTSVTIQYVENGVTKTTTQKITVNATSSDTPGDTTPETPETPSDTTPETPTLTDMTNTKSVITDSKLYFSSSDLTKGTSEVTIKISGIKKGNTNNTYTYYYYISGTYGDTNITNWTKAVLKEESDGTYSITLNVKSEDLQNYESVSQSDNLYVYLREVAEINQQSAQQIVTLQTEDQSEPDCYVDGVYVGNIDNVLNYNSNNTGNTNQNKDDTVAPGILPNTGTLTFKIIVGILIILFGSFAYYRYKNIDR